MHYEGIPAPQIEHSIISQEILNDLIIEIGTKFKPIMDNETKILDDLTKQPVIPPPLRWRDVRASV